MKTGRTKGAEELTRSSVGKVLLGVMGIGLASGAALIAGTNMIMSKLFPEAKEAANEEESLEEE